jgi:nucleoid-associated protein YgaU
MKGGTPMLDDLRQEKQEPPLDPLSEGTSIPLSKKVALLCLAVALIGLFIFFTSDSWSSSDSKHSKHMKKQDVSKELDQIKARLTDIEMKINPQVAATTGTEQPSPFTPSKENEGATGGASINLQALIEQELQESNNQPASKDEEKTAPAQEKKAPAAAKKQQTYTVQKGDSLSKISQKVYGSTKYWKRIVDANKDKLGKSQTLKPGMVLSIPKGDDK